MNSDTISQSISLCLISCRQGSLTSESTVPANGQLPDTTDITNNFYDNTLTNALQQYDLIIEGEVANPGKVNFSTLPVHSVIVKETLLDSTGGDRFVGAYRYDGYSLFDILNKCILKKSNADEFNPITEPDEDGGLFRVFPASDFFSDRAIKSLSEIHLIR